MKHSLGVVIIMSIMASACLHSGDTTDQATDPNIESTQTHSTAGSTQPNSNMITTQNQPPGNILYVREIYLEFPGYVAIHKIDSNGNLGEMIGITHAIEGNKKQVDVTLDQPVTTGETVAVVLYRDDGDIQFNSPETDPPVTNEQGQILVSTFTVDQTATHPLEE